MYKLKKVYAILSIKKENIDLTVIDKSNNFFTCLFNKTVNLLDNKNIDILSKEIENLIVEADNFIGVRTKRVLLEISSDILLNTALIENYEQILSKNNLEILSISSKEIFFENFIENNKQMIVNIDKNQTSINHYQNKKLIKSDKVEIGYDALVNYVSNKTTINKNIVFNVIKDFDYKNFEKYDFPLVTIFDNKYLSINQINSKKMQAIITNGISKLKNILENEIRKSCDVIKTYYQDYIYIYTNEIDQTLFSNNWKNTFFNGVKMKSIASNEKIIGISKIKTIECISFISWYEKENKNIKYSIDPFVSQDITSEQIKKDLIIKLGIISTKLSAKLGG